MAAPHRTFALPYPHRPAHESDVWPDNMSLSQALHVFNDSAFLHNTQSIILSEIRHMIVQSNSTMLLLSDPEFPSNFTSLETVHVNLVLYHFNRKTKCRGMWSDYMYEFACKVCD